MSEQKERSLLKKTIYEKLNEVNREISRLETMKSFANADIKVIEIKLTCLLSHKKDIEDLILICANRNRF